MAAPLVDALPVAIPPGAYVRIAVIDSGEGMDYKTVSRMFEPFFSTKPPDQGIGLGFSMCLRLVSAARGFVLVDSQRGKGTTVAVYLPPQDPGTMSVS